MKVIKRDGRTIEFDKTKIEIAIEKANKEVRGQEKATKDEINEIISYIEDLGKKRILVEDIQDIIEKKLMEFNKYELAKKYIVYRYTRTLVRKSNTTDESILGLIRNNNKELEEENLDKNTLLASTQRDCIAGEVSRDLTKRILLPEKISKAHEEGILYFHDADYFIQPIFNCSLINLGDMLDNGTVINGEMIETPKSFQVACIIMTQIIASVASNQYGGQSVDIGHLGKYLRKSRDKFEKELTEKYAKRISQEIINDMVEERLKDELTSGVQSIQYQINTLMTTKGKPPIVTLILHVKPDDKYVKENVSIIEEILKQRIQGVKDEAGNYITPEFPKLIYVLDECNCLKGGEYDYLTELAIKCSRKRKYPNYISAKKMKENYDENVFYPMGDRNFLTTWKDEKGNYKFEGRFNQGIVTINRPQIGILSQGNEENFWKLLDERLELCKEALMCRHYALLDTLSNISPIHWQNGAIARLKKDEKIDKLLKNGYSTISLGYVGIYETTKLMKGVSHTTLKGHDFAIKLMKYLRDCVDKWKKETNIAFTLYGTPNQTLCHRFARIDKELFGNITDVTDKGYYTNSYFVDYREEQEILSKLKFESEFQDLSLGGGISYIDISNVYDDLDEIRNIIKFVYENVQYVGLNNVKLRK